MNRAEPIRVERPPVGRPTRGECFLGIAVLGVDQLTKYLTQSAGCGTVVCPLTNPGLMLGLVDSDIYVVLFSLAGLSLFACWVRSLAGRAPISWTGVVLVVAGVAGNAVDRLTLGSVRDFAVVTGNAVVNVADMAIAIGLVACGLPLISHPFSRAQSKGGEPT